MKFAPITENIDFDKLTPVEVFAPSENVSDDNLLQRGGQFAKGLVARGVQAPFKLAENIVGAGEWLAEKAGVPKSQSKGPELPSEAEEFIKNFGGNEPLSEKVANIFGGEKAIKPENWFSEGLQKSAENWPLLFLGGGPTIAKGVADLSSSFGGVAAKKMGFGTVGQVVGSLIGGALPGVAKLFHAAGKAPALFGPAKDRLYKAEANLGSKIKTDPTNLIEELTNIHDDAAKHLISKSVFSKEAQSNVKKNIANITSKLDHKNVTAADIFNVKKDINNIFSPIKSVENTFIKRISSVVNESLKEIGKENPEWGNVSKAANELHKISLWPSNLKNWMIGEGKGKVNQILKNPVGQAALTLLGGIVGGPYGWATAAAGAAPLATAAIKGGKGAAESGLKFLTYLSKSKEGRNLLSEIALNSGKNSFGALASSVNKFNKMANKFTATNKMKFTPITENIDFDKLTPVSMFTPD